MRRHTVHMLIIILGVLLLTDCVARRRVYEIPESQQSIDIGNWYTIKFGYLFCISPRFQHPIPDSGDLLLDTIPMLAIDSVCIRLDDSDEDYWSRTYRGSDLQYEEYLLNDTLPNPGEHLDLARSNGWIIPQYIYPLREMPAIRESSCKVITVSFPVKLLDRVTKAVIDSQFVTVNYYRGWDYYLWVGE